MSVSKQFKQQAKPAQSVQALNSFDRALGGMVQMELGQRPADNTQRDLAGDIFHYLHKEQPELLDEVPAGRQVNKALLEWMGEGAGFADAADQCAGSIVASRAAAGIIWHNLVTDEALAAALERQQEADWQEKVARDNQALADAYDQAGMPAPPQDYAGQADKARQAAEAASAEAMAALAAQVNNPLTRARMADKAGQAAEQAKEINDVMKGWGMGPGTATYEDPAEALAFYEQLTPHARRIADIAGRVRAAMAGSRRERVASGAVAVDMQYTQDLNLVLPEQTIRMANGWPVADQVVARMQYLASGLLGIMPGGDEDAAGDFVVGTDVSGSMKGGRDAVAKGIALGMAQAARDSDSYREYQLFAFSSGSQAITTVRSTDSWRLHMEWAGASAGGGTDFDLAMEQAMDEMMLMRRPDDADFTIISDGIGRVDNATADRWRGHADLYGWRMLFVPVASDRMGVNGTSLAELADEVIGLAELDAEHGTDLAREAMTRFYR